MNVIGMQLGVFTPTLFGCSYSIDYGVVDMRDRIYVDFKAGVSKGITGTVFFYKYTNLSLGVLSNLFLYHLKVLYHTNI